ncbi:hypothetical protein D3C72_2324540 [compost metagenome]
MRVVLTDHVTDNTRRFLVGTVPVVGKLMHGVQHPAMHGLEAISDIRKGAADDHAHRVIEIGTAHLLFQANRECFLGKKLVGHGNP